IGISVYENEIHIIENFVFSFYGIGFTNDLWFVDRLGMDRVSHSRHMVFNPFYFYIIDIDIHVFTSEQES
ncbi:hypothetical protein, partial [Paenibacillus polymyxa]|uniref:hypothetical protein n=1 Tax=Paenibacillus polymyxa TaxID=1406 RepID=UPI001E5BAAF7